MDSQKQARAAAEQVNPNDALHNMKQHRDGLLQQLTQARASYANNHINLACDTAQKLLLAEPTDIFIAHAIDLGVDFAEAFRKRAKEYTPLLIAEAPVDQLMIAEVESMETLIAETEDVIAQAVKQQEERAKLAEVEQAETD